MRMRSPVTTTQLTMRRKIKLKKSKIRVGKGAYYCFIAYAVSLRSTCLRRQYGCVIVKNDEIIATGYNGSPRGEANCCDVGLCWREAHDIPHGEQYEKCQAVHAEQNAILSAPREKLIGSTLYLFGREGNKVITSAPCDICDKFIKNAGIKEVVTPQMPLSTDMITLFGDASLLYSNIGKW